MSNSWKVTAIIFIILFLLETLFFGWAIWAAIQDENRMKECYYEVCSEYVDAYYEDNICTCYEADMFGEYIVAKTQWIN